METDKSHYELVQDHFRSELVKFDGNQAPTTEERQYLMAVFSLVHTRKMPQPTLMAWPNDKGWQITWMAEDAVFSMKMNPLEMRFSAKGINELGVSVSMQFSCTPEDVKTIPAQQAICQMVDVVCEPEEFDLEGLKQYAKNAPVVQNVVIMWETAYYDGPLEGYCISTHPENQFCRFIMVDQQEYSRKRLYAVYEISILESLMAYVRHGLWSVISSSGVLLHLYQKMHSLHLKRHAKDNFKRLADRRQRWLDNHRIVCYFTD